MREISLPQYVQCKTDTTKFIPKLNCSYWSYDKNGDCKAHCELKNIGVSFPVCFRCTDRKPIQERRDVPENFANPAQQMKAMLPQYNYYSKENLETLTTQDKSKDTSFMEKAKSYAKAEGSQLLNGKVSEEVYNKRKEICLACPQKSNHVPEKEPIGWCLSCGCSSKNERAALSNKLWMPSLECPLKKFGKEDGRGFNANDAVNSVKGAVQAIGSLFKKDESDGKEN